MKIYEIFNRTERLGLSKIELEEYDTIHQFEQVREINQLKQDSRTYFALAIFQSAIATTLICYSCLDMDDCIVLGIFGICNLLLYYKALSTHKKYKKIYYDIIMENI